MQTENHIADDRKKVRLIDANELMKFPIRIDHYDKVNGNEHFVLGIESVLEYAENLQTVDAVEVVRCKDCKHYGWVKEHCHGRTQRFCRLHKGLIVVNGDTFCSYGERRTDGR